MLNCLIIFLILWIKKIHFTSTSTYIHIKGKDKILEKYIVERKEKYIIEEWIEEKKKKLRRDMRKEIEKINKQMC